VGGKGASLEVENWLRADADARDPKDESVAAGIACDEKACTGMLGGGGQVLLVLDPDGFQPTCADAAVVVSRFRAPTGCGEHAVVIDRDGLARFGAHALWRTGPGSQAAKAFALATAYPAVHRPFMPPLPVGTPQ
jgi:competence protein ComEC